MASLTSSLVAAAKRHHIRLLGVPKETAWSIVSLGERMGEEVYVKVLSPQSDERLAPALLDAWRTGPVVRVLEARDSVHILERVNPGTSLGVDYDRLGDDESLVVLGTIASSLRKLGAKDIGFPDARARGQSLLVRSRPACIDEDLWEKAIQRYADLADSQRGVGVVHGDLHHGNVLLDDARGWVVIDPKGVVAELEFEMACALRNPISRVDQWATASQLEKRARLLARTLGLSEVRLLEWSFAQSVLAAAWEVEDKLDPAPWVAVARAYDAQLSARL